MIACNLDTVYIYLCVCWEVARLGDDILSVSIYDRPIKSHGQPLGPGKIRSEGESERTGQDMKATADKELAETKLTGLSDEQARQIVRRFLDASMVPDPETAMTFMSPGVSITFTGGRRCKHPREIAEVNGRRYKKVKKQIDNFDVVRGADETIVYCVGTLYGEWPDGQPFKDNRYIDRFVIRGGLIVQMDVWNDSAERLLDREGLDI